MSPSRIWTSLVRLASIGAGLIVEYRQVFVVREAQLVIVLFGLWLMAVPPALWLDALWRFSRAAKSLGDGPGPGAGPGGEP